MHFLRLSDFAPHTERTAETLAEEYGFASIEAMRDDIPQGSKILDVGAGCSNLLEVLTEGRPDITAVAVDIGYGADPDDVSWIQKVVRKYSSQNPIETMRPTDRVALIGAAALQLPFQDGSFQRVYSYYLLPWIPKRKQDRALDEMVRVSDKDTGKVMVGPYPKTNGSFTLERIPE